MRVAALDLGEARVGVALADELSMYAHPRGFIPAKPRDAFLAKLKELVASEGITHWVVGLPLDMRGGEGDAARKVRLLSQQIADATGCEIELWDERLSTVQAKRHLDASDMKKRNKRAHIDEASAVVILQAFLDRPARVPSRR